MPVDSQFNYDRPASGNSFLSRKGDVDLLSQYIKNGQSVTLYTAPKAGKQSVISQTFRKLQSDGFESIRLTFNLFNVRSRKNFINLYKERLVELSKMLDKEALFPLNLNPDMLSESDVMDLPERMSQTYGRTLLIYFKEFQNILFMDDSDELLHIMEKEIIRHHNAVYLITGSQLNAMKYIFEEKKYFYGGPVNMELTPLKRSDVITYLHNSFQRTGREISDEMSGEIFDICGGHPWYINHLASVCYSVTLGYVNINIINSAKETMFAIHQPHFMQVMADLTDNQINLLRAVSDGVSRFSSAEVLKKYSLNSSANVFRVKEALKKKEVVTFDSQDRASIIDPLFAYWLKYIYFKDQKL